MDLQVVFDCRKVIPNRLSLTLASAVRSRALGKGAMPWREANAGDAKEIALQEITAGVFHA